MTHAIRTALGSAPIPWAMDIQIGAIRAVVAVFDIKFVSAQVTMNMTRRSTIGLGSAPRSPTILSAISSPAPVVSNAFASVREPPKRNTTFRSMEFSDVFLGNNSCQNQEDRSDTCGNLNADADLFLKDHCRITRISTTRETVCFHFGT